MTVAEPDERWAELGRRACVVLAPLFLAVKHVGSPAEPVIDLMASTADPDAVDDAALAALGYRMLPSPQPGRLLYRREDYDSTAYHLHVVVVEPT